MVYVKVRNATRNIVLGQKVRPASSFVDRAIGLLTTPSLGAGEGLWLKPCASIHTLFMRYPIDALFLDTEGFVLGRQTLHPWRFSKWFAHTRSVVELAAGALEPTGTKAGDRIVFEDVN
jgi:uncharacterized membrane protein (UPF0127 family)